MSDNRWSNEDFVDKYMEAYRGGHSQVWIADQLNIAPSTVGQRKRRLLYIGVRLPELNRRKTVNVNDLNKLIDESM